MTKNIIISIITAAVLGLFGLAGTVSAYAAIAWADNRYIIAAESLFVYAQRLRREIHNERQQVPPNKSTIEFLELQLQETEAELKKRAS